jgi:hypothetical protein
MWECWLFFLPATLVSFSLYLLWLLFGQASVLPLDLNRRWGGQALVGGGRGLLSIGFVCIIGSVCAVVQGRGDDALILALGAHFGTVANSFLKRRFHFERGKHAVPWDHIDFVLGASLAYSLQYPITLQMVMAGIVICGTLHWSLGRLIRLVLDPFRRERRLDS